ncbi:MAG TPA: serine hydrolase [Lysobacter sp.]|nr:serine hydrolase [Lysobacter sp.]
MRRRAFLTGAAAALSAPLWAGRADPGYWERVFARLPPHLADVAFDPEHQVQLLCVRVERATDGPTRYRRFAHGLAPRRWFSTGSVIKLPMALLMAERVSLHRLDAGASVVLHAPPATGEWPDGEPLAEPFARGLARTFAVSDNAPYNRWYEYLGADAMHARLAELGYPHARLIARLGSTDAAANRRSGGGELKTAAGETMETRAPASARERCFPFGAAFGGRAWQHDDGTISDGPRDFSRANFLPLEDSLAMLQAFLAPDSVPAWRRWRIDGALRAQLLRALALRPRDSVDPRYSESTHPDGYARWFFVGGSRERLAPSITVFGKSGMAYGYLSEVAWVVDREQGAEFLLGASIYANRDGVLNDDRYDYERIGLPFLRAVGAAVLEMERELRRRRS